MHCIHEIFGEKILVVVHNTGVVVSIAKQSGRAILVLDVLVLSCLEHVVVEDLHVLVSVWSIVLMIEANGMAKLMNDGCKVDAGGT